MGGALLGALGFVGSLTAMAAGLFVVLIGTVVALPSGLGKAKSKVKFTTLFSKSSAVNWLSAARLFLFSARDVWFVVGLPVFLASTLHWSFWQVGAFCAAWFVGYGIVQAIVPGGSSPVGCARGGHRRYGTPLGLRARRDPAGPGGRTSRLTRIRPRP